MRDVEFRKYHATHPFVRFTMHLADGRTFRVEHPEFAMISPEGRTVFIELSDAVTEIIDIGFIISLTMGNEA